MRTSSKILLALGLGAVVGAVLGILYAPAKGSDTRKKVSDKAHDLADKMKGMKDTIKGRYRASHDGRPRVESEVDEGVA